MKHLDEYVIVHRKNHVDAFAVSRRSLANVLDGLLTCSVGCREIHYNVALLEFQITENSIYCCCGVWHEHDLSRDSVSIPSRLQKNEKRPGFPLTDMSHVTSLETDPRTTQKIAIPRRWAHLDTMRLQHGI